MVASALRWLSARLPALLVASACVLAAGGGFLTSVALGTSTADPVTTTISVATGPQGPPGPPGPKGEPGSGFSCPQGFSEGELVIDHPGGQVAIWTCLKT